MELWNGFQLKRESFEGRELIIVFPQKANGKWAIKTEYFDAFPEVQIELLRQGYHIVHIKNITRWHVWEDTDIRAKVAKYMHTEYKLSKKCVIIGMSCGGMQGIYFASKHPEYVSCMYLDAPVMNYLSCPAGIGIADNNMFEEFKQAKGIGLSELINLREHPIDFVPDLIKHNIPIILVCGDSDTVVPYIENGKLLQDAYLKNGCTIKTIIKNGCDHHPHSLEDNTPIIEFINKYDKD